MSNSVSLADRIRELLTEEEADLPEDRASDAAVQRAIDITHGAADAVSPDVLEQGWPSSTVDNGVSITWRNRGAKRIVTLRTCKDDNVAPGTYIYHQDESAHGVDMDADGAKLGSWLAWLWQATSEGQ